MHKILITITLFSLILASCGTFQVSLEEVPTGTALASSPLPPTATSVPGTATVPAATDVPVPTRIDFAAGATQSVTQGTLRPGQASTFVLNASQGQILIASADSPDRDVSLSITGADGTTFLPEGPAGLDSFTGILPTTQDYTFKLTGGASAEAYTLNIIIAARIRFAAGAKQSVLTGRTVDGLPVTYSAYAQKGQQMNVTLDVTGDSAGLTIWGLNDGEPYARAQNGIRNFSLVLPSAQDYIIQVFPRAGQAVDYTLTVQIQ